MNLSKETVSFSWNRFLKTSALFLKKRNYMQFGDIRIEEIITITFTLFAVIDILGSIPILISLKDKMGGSIRSMQATVASGAFMVLFLFLGQSFLNLLGLDVQSFAVAGSIVIFIIGLEMILGVEFFKPDTNPLSGSLVPIAFPLIAGSGTLTTIMSLNCNFSFYGI